MKKINVDKLLEKNPDARGSFEIIQEALASLGRTSGSRTANYGLALPYGARKIVIEDSSSFTDSYRTTYHNR
ncbi:MAG: hypothetical protein IID51_12445 [Proteobacteria bacterium]|nr:hypothetical protein [Pseudomonadota bacterium]